ncbi:hypothetical protein B0H16DRAFT_1550113, partial [Mycena metata]
MWSSAGMQPYLSITIHWLGWRETQVVLCQALLAFRRVRCHESGFSPPFHSIHTRPAKPGLPDTIRVIDPSNDNRTASGLLTLERQITPGTLITRYAPVQPGNTSRRPRSRTTRDINPKRHAIARGQDRHFKCQNPKSQLPCDHIQTNDRETPVVSMGRRLIRSIATKVVY